MNFVPAQVKDGELELPFTTVPISDEWRSRLGDRDVLIAGIRPGNFEDAEMVDPSKKDQGVTFDVTVDVTEWLGNEQYAFVPFEAPEDIAATLSELQSDLDSEQMRTQMVVALDPLSRVQDSVTLWMDPTRMHLFDPKSGENLTRVVEDSQDRTEVASGS
jgi:multiple sugar transport system ATP-binding protein